MAEGCTLAIHLPPKQAPKRESTRSRRKQSYELSPKPSTGRIGIFPALLNRAKESTERNRTEHG